MTDWNKTLQKCKDSTWLFVFRPFRKRRFERHVNLSSVLLSASESRWITQKQFPLNSAAAVWQIVSLFRGSFHFSCRSLRVRISGTILPALLCRFEPERCVRSIGQSWIVTSCSQLVVAHQCHHCHHCSLLPPRSTFKHKIVLQTFEFVATAFGTALIFCTRFGVYVLHTFTSTSQSLTSSLSFDLKSTLCLLRLDRLNLLHAFVSNHNNQKERIGKQPDYENLSVFWLWYTSFFLSFFSSLFFSLFRTLKSLQNSATDRMTLTIKCGCCCWTRSLCNSKLFRLQVLHLPFFVFVAFTTLLAFAGRSFLFSCSFPIRSSLARHRPPAFCVSWSFQANGFCCLHSQVPTARVSRPTVLRLCVRALLRQADSFGLQNHFSTILNAVYPSARSICRRS